MLTVVQYDLSEVMDDMGTLAALRTVISTSLKDNRIGSVVDPKCLVLFGHRCELVLPCVQKQLGGGRLKDEEKCLCACAIIGMEYKAGLVGIVVDIHDLRLEVPPFYTPKMANAPGAVRRRS
jgi:hypothetical protein